MATSCWIWALAFLAVYLAILWASKSARFFSKLFFYGVCIVCASSIGSILIIFNGRTTDNHCKPTLWRRSSLCNLALIFKIFQISLFWMNIRVRLENEELLESDEPFVLIANHQAALDVYSEFFCYVSSILRFQLWPTFGPRTASCCWRSSLKYVPGFNLCTYLCCAIYINRFDKTRAHQS